MQTEDKNAIFKLLFIRASYHQIDN